MVEAARRHSAMSEHMHPGDAKSCHGAPTSPLWEDDSLSWRRGAAHGSFQGKQFLRWSGNSVYAWSRQAGRLKVKITFSRSYP